MGLYSIWPDPGSNVWLWPQSPLLTLCLIFMFLELVSYTWFWCLCYSTLVSHISIKGTLLPPCSLGSTVTYENVLEFYGSSLASIAIVFMLQYYSRRPCQMHSRYVVYFGLKYQWRHSWICVLGQTSGPISLSRKKIHLIGWLWGVNEIVSMKW